ncbi:unnamed protein product [Toxocara canis]|uniref:Gelsolin-like domain-containing protein n=1 Tax=Toxocara canis TaxID=6265 RepID=A0A183UJ14_TOXCA|nr:unnamed protein product [Toxocara canis]
MIIDIAMLCQSHTNRFVSDRVDVLLWLGKRRSIFEEFVDMFQGKNTRHCSNAAISDANKGSRGTGVPRGKHGNNLALVGRAQG